MTKFKTPSSHSDSGIIDLAEVNLTYDPAFSVALENNPPLAKAILAPILKRNDFEVKSVRTQALTVAVYGHSITFDCLIEFSDGTYCNLEMQKVKAGMPFERMAYHRALLMARYSLEKGEEKFKKLKPTIVVVLLDDDLTEEGLPLYRYSYHAEHSGEDVEPGQGIYVVNLRMKDASTELGRLMEDISASDPKEVHNPVFSDALDMLKSKEGVKLMSDYRERMSEELKEEWLAKGIEQGKALGLEEGRTLGLEEGKKNALIALYRDGFMTLEDASKCLGITTEEFLKLVEEQGGK